MVKRISITLSKSLRSKITDWDKMDSEFKECVGTALRVPADIASIAVNDLSRGARFPYDHARTPGWNIKTFQQMAREILGQTERLVADIFEPPSLIIWCLVVQIKLYERNMRQPLAEVIVRVTGDAMPCICRWSF